MRNDPEARNAYDALFNRLADLQCVLHCAAETFGDYTGMDEGHAKAAVVVNRTVADLGSIRDGFEAWEMKYALLRPGDFSNHE